MLSVKQGDIKYHFKVFGMTQTYPYQNMPEIFRKILKTVPEGSLFNSYYLLGKILTNFMD